MSTWQYILSFIAGAFFPLALGGYGGHLAAVALPDKPSKRRRALVLVWTLAGLGVASSGVQQVVSFHADHQKDLADAADQTSIGSKLDGLRTMLSTLMANAQTGNQQKAILAAQNQIDSLKPDLSRIEQESSQGPKMALVNARIDLENAIISRMETDGHAAAITTDPISNIRLEEGWGYVNSNLAQACVDFINLETRLVNTMATPQSAFEEAASAGRQLVQALASLPSQINEVLYTDIPLFSDPNGAVPVRNAVGLMIQETVTESKQKNVQVFPTTVAGYYKRGMILTWEWQPSPQWGPTWYLDPRTGRIEKAFDGSLDFVPRDIRERWLKRRQASSK